MSLFFLCFFLGASLLSGELFAGKQAAIYSRLDPCSLAQLAAFYELYPDTPEGERALQRIAALLHLSSQEAKPFPAILAAATSLSEEQIAWVEALGKKLANRKLKGYLSSESPEQLSSSEIDLGSAILPPDQARSYSAQLDLMALQILAQLPEQATAEEKIRETNRFIFEEMRFRFPPHSLYAEAIDRFTFLPSVMDNHLGVCLGVVTLYLALAERLDLPLEIITPPGHIYIRFSDPQTKKVLNIETTARGISLPTDTYLTLQAPSLKLRELKEVVGMRFINEASVYLHLENYEEAARSYEAAFRFIPKDPLLFELLGYTYLFLGKEESGRQFLRAREEIKGEEIFGLHTASEDYLAGKVDQEGLKAVLSKVDETRASVFCKQKKLKEVLARSPLFREGWYQLAVTWMQLNRNKEAIEALLAYRTLDPSHPVVNYYLAMLHKERYDFPQAWFFLKETERLSKNTEIKALKELRHELSLLSPEFLTHLTHENSAIEKSESTACCR